MRKKEKLSLEKVINMDIELMSGKTPRAVARDHGVPTEVIKNATETIGTIMESTTPTLAMEREIISSVLTERLKPIKENLAVKSLEIVNLADKLTVERLKDPIRPIKTKDLLAVSDIHSRRLARLTGIEEDPGAGDDSTIRTRDVKDILKTIFNKHDEVLEGERSRVNEQRLEPIVIEPESLDNSDKI